MKHQALTQGMPVLLKTADGLDEHGEPWKYGSGPFVVCRIITPVGRKEPWIRLRSGALNRELPGSFRAKELVQA